MLYCKEYQDSRFWHLASSQTRAHWKALLFHRNCLRSGQQQVSSHDGSVMQIFGAGLYKDCTMHHSQPLTNILPGAALCVGHCAGTVQSLQLLSIVTTYNLVNLLRITIHLLSTGQRLHCHCHVEIRMVKIK